MAIRAPDGANNSPGGDVGDGGCDSGVLLCILF